MAAYDPSGLPDMSDEQPPQATNGDYSYDQQENAEEDDDDYDPSSFDFGGNGEQAPAPQTLSDTQLPAQEPEPAKPKTVGGFIVEDEDEEDEEEQDAPMGESQAPPAPAPSQLNGAEGAHSGLGAVAVSNAAGEDVSLASAPTQDSAAATQADNSLNGSTAITATEPVPSTPAVPDTTLPSLPVAAPAASPALADLGKAPASASTLAPTAAAGTASVSATPKPSINGIAAPSEGTAVMAPATTIQQRLPHDKVGRLEDRIRDDPKSDVDAWWELIQHYKDKDQLDNTRKVFERMLEVWPASPRIYTALLDLESQSFDANRPRIESLFSQALPRAPVVELWAAYLSYLRRVFPLIPDPQGNNRAIITQAFDAVLSAVGSDPEAADLWKDYIEFVKSGPGVIGGQGWQDLQKVDALRKAYQKAIKVPGGGVTALWKEYDGFEMQQNKAQGRKNMQDLSPHYMTARTAEKQLHGIIDGLDRRSIATLPPVEGCEGDDAFAAQVQRWRAWVEWEKADPLVLREEDIEAYRNRVLVVYKQATIYLRFWPRIWYEAAQWCFEQVPPTDELTSQGDSFLDDGLKANPESVLLTLKKADKVEESMQVGTVEDAVAIANGEKLDAVYEPCHTALYALNKKLTERRDKAVAEVKEYFASLPPEEEPEQTANPDEDDDEREAGDSPVEKPKTRAEQLQERVKAVQDGAKVQLKILSKTISYVWVAKMRAFRRIQGQGKPNQPTKPKGFRGVFGEARPRGQLSADVYVASALMEHHCYKDPSAQKIFERGLKLFPTDEGFALDYIRHLINTNDLTNARVVFETTVTKILGAVKLFPDEAERKEKVRPLLGFMHEFESCHGDLSQVRKLESRLKELYPGEPDAVRFGERYLLQGFDGIEVQLVLSLAQVKPKTAMALPIPPHLAPGMMEGLQSTQPDGLRLGPNGPYMASPKRPLDDDTDTDTPRKFMRAESPLKGTRRAVGHSATASVSGGTLTTNVGSGGFMTKNFVPNTSPMAAAQPPQAAGPAPLPGDITLILSVLPSASTYNSVLFEPNRLVGLLRGLDVDAQRPRIMHEYAQKQQQQGVSVYGGR